MTHSDKIKKLNILEKLINQKLISIKASLGETTVVEQLNEDVRQFLVGKMEEILSGTPSNSSFSNNQLVVLSQLADKLLAKVSQGGAVVDSPLSAPPAPPLEEIEQPENAHVAPIAPPPTRKQGSPVLDALKGAGFNPDATPQERIAAVKKAAHIKKG